METEGMNSLISEIRNCIETQLDAGCRDFIVFPYGDVGMQVKSFLNNVYGIQEKMIIDNHLCKYNCDIKPISELETIDCENMCVILACTNVRIYSALKKELSRHLGRNHIAELNCMKARKKEDENAHCKPSENYIADHDGNRIQGYIPELTNTTISFQGKNNILYCEQGVQITNSIIGFKGDNSVIYISKTGGPLMMHLTSRHESVIRIGKNNTTSNERFPMWMLASSGCTIFTGDDCMISHSVMFRTADPHLIYNSGEGTRTGSGKSIYLGDHVWLGQDVALLKGTWIDSGCIVGEGSIVSGKHMKSNECWCGNPAQCIKGNVFWERHSVDNERLEVVDKSRTYKEYMENVNPCILPDYWIYSFEPENEIGFQKIEEELSARKSSWAKLDYLIELNNETQKNRFVHKH